MKLPAIRIFRVVMFAGILLCIHWQHQKLVRAEAESAKWSDVMPVLRDVISEASDVQPIENSAAAEILDKSPSVIGTAIRTSPIADHIIGFSGPTDVLVVFSEDGLVRAARVVSSRDTREHVQRVLDDRKFLTSLVGRSRKELQNLRDVDAVSGATLTSYAILESIQHCASQLGDADHAGSEARRVTSLRFPDPPRLEDVRVLYSAAAKLEPDRNSQCQWQVLDADGKVIGALLRSSPAADNSIGYQGPTDVLVAFDSGGSVTGIAIGASYDNEPYVGYVREDKYFRNLFNGRDAKSLAAIESGLVEGVSGATMTSQSAAKSIQIAAESLIEEQRRSAVRDVVSPVQEQSAHAFSERGSINLKRLSGMLTLSSVSTIVMTIFGVVLGLTRLRGRRWVRIGFQITLIGWLGLINGDLVSQASLLGWAQNGIPWPRALGLTTLTFAALLVPIATRRNVYCSHICPHGAVQQLIRRRLPWQWKLSPVVTRRLAWIPGILIAWVVAVGMLHLPFSPIDIEPFDAWLLTIAGTATILVAVTGLALSAFVPMAYCRFGCPTGAMLDFVGSAHGKSWGRRDTIATVLFSATVIVLILY